MTIILAAAILVCIYLSNFFSGSEMAYSSVNKMRLESEEEEGNRRARIALYITEHFDDALSTILIGNNLVNIACSSMGSVLVILLLGSDQYAWLSTLVITIAVIIFGETIPKITAKKGANHYALRYAWPIRILMFILKPMVLLIVGLVNLLTLPFKGETAENDADAAVEERQTIIETAEDEAVLDEDQSELVQNAIDFNEVMASEAMTARVDVVALDINDSFQKNLAIIERASFSRIPVYEDSIDNVIGILYMNRFLKEYASDRHVDIRSLLMSPCHIYKTTRLPDVLAELRKEKQHMAIVVDEYGGTLGVITMEDVLEQVVGEIWDETDTIETEIEEVGDHIYEVDGDLPIDEFLDLMEIRKEDFEGESETLGGFTIETNGTFPKEGDVVCYEDIRITVLKMDGLRVERVRVERVEPEASGDVEERE